MIGRDEETEVRAPLVSRLAAAGWSVRREVTAYQPSISRSRNMRVRVDVYAECRGVALAIECKHVLRNLDELRTAARQAQGYMSAFDWQHNGTRLPRPQIALVATEHTLSGTYVDQEGGHASAAEGIVWSPLLYAQYFTLHRELWDFGAAFLMGPRLHWIERTGKRRHIGEAP